MVIHMTDDTYNSDYRAFKLLMSMLDAEQQLSFTSEGLFWVHKHGRSFMITPTFTVLKVDNTIGLRYYCSNVGDNEDMGLSAFDNMLAKKVLIEADEGKFFYHANEISPCFVCVNELVPFPMMPIIDHHLGSWKNE